MGITHLINEALCVFPRVHPYILFYAPTHSVQKVYNLFNFQVIIFFQRIILLLNNNPGDQVIQIMASNDVTLLLERLIGLFNILVTVTPNSPAQIDIG